MAEWYKLVINFRSNTVATQECVDGESEIQCRTILWHGLDFSLRGKYKDFRSEQVQFDGVKEIHGIRLWVIQDFFDGTEPFFQFAFIVMTISVFVFPVGCKSLFCNVVHAFTADLYFNPLSLVTHECNMERLITVWFRMVYPIPQAVWVWLVYFRNRNIDTETFVQFRFLICRFEDDAYCQDVVNLFKWNMLGLHLVPNGIRRFYAG